VDTHTQAYRHHGQKQLQETSQAPAFHTWFKINTYLGNVVSSDKKLLLLKFTIYLYVINNYNSSHFTSHFIAMVISIEDIASPAVNSQKQCFIKFQQELHDGTML